MLLLAIACNPNSSFVIEYYSQAVVSFALEDVNEHSSTYGSLVATTDFPEKVSAWYFGHST